MDSEVLAQELLDRMKGGIPSGIGVSTEGDRLIFRSSYSTGKAGSYACQWLHKERGACRSECGKQPGSLLAIIKTFDEETTEPWPGTTSPPIPDARKEGGRVIVWFGDPHAPDLTITPLALGDQ
jgi:hypothetical protein